MSWTKVGQASLTYTVCYRLHNRQTSYKKLSVHQGEAGTPVGPTPTPPIPLGTRDA